MNFIRLLSVSHFARSFRRTFATSAHRYLILQRIEKAKELLATSHLSLPEVGLASGFSDQAAFRRMFKAVVGASPGKWQGKLGTGEAMPEMHSALKQVNNVLTLVGLAAPAYVSSDSVKECWLEAAAAES